MAGERKTIPAATQAALWALSNGRCYIPGCPFPVIVEVRPGVYKKNAQIAHIYGVSGPRRKEGLSVRERDAFSNLLLLCLAHHNEVDDENYGEDRYRPELLRKWKVDHEGGNGPALAALGTIDEGSLSKLLASVFSPPMKRLQAIAEQLEETGTLNAETVAELRQIVYVLANTPPGPDARTAHLLMSAADVFGNVLNTEKIQKLGAIAEQISAASRNIRRYGGFQ